MTTIEKLQGNVVAAEVVVIVLPKENLLAGTGIGIMIPTEIKKENENELIMISMVTGEDLARKMVAGREKIMRGTKVGRETGKREGQGNHHQALTCPYWLVDFEGMNSVYIIFILLAFCSRDGYDENIPSL